MGSGQSSGIEKVYRREIKHVIAVGSGKGGVGKSSVTALLAVGACREGFKAGILDADITGPSIPKMFGLKTISGNKGFAPMDTSRGIKIMSLNLLLPSEDDPVIWRAVDWRSVKQFWTEVDWESWIIFLLTFLRYGRCSLNGYANNSTGGTGYC